MSRPEMISGTLRFSCGLPNPEAQWQRAYILFVPRGRLDLIATGGISSVQRHQLLRHRPRRPTLDFPRCWLPASEYLF